MASQRPKPLKFNFPARPSSPPQTPHSKSMPPLIPNMQPEFQRFTAPSFDQVPPDEFVKTTRSGLNAVHGYSANLTELSPRSSSPASMSEASEFHPGSFRRRVHSQRRHKTSFLEDDSGSESEEEFTVEELHEDEMVTEDEDKIVRPDHYEDAESDSEGNESKRRKIDDEDLDSKTGIVSEFQNLCAAGLDGFGNLEEQERRYQRRNKRWSLGHKRTHTQSIVSDSSEEVDDSTTTFGAVGSPKRLRRKGTGPGRRSSLIFDDPMGEDKVTEVSESEDDTIPMPVLLPEVSHKPVVEDLLSTPNVYSMDVDYEEHAFF
ncbi:MAG: hypothetical protein M1824_000213 [Vezdaea acicularis]|nr:MAG: hypothetical protein M1824_000213 [Vezdaea acicularis]